MKNSDPKLYRKLSEPFESQEAANSALQAFQEELYELRVKHRIRDLAFVAQIVIAKDEDEFEAMVSNHYGDSLKEVILFGYAYGRATARHEQLPAESRNHGARLGKADRE